MLQSPCDGQSDSIGKSLDALSFDSGELSSSMGPISGITKPSSTLTLILQYTDAAWNVEDLGNVSYDSWVLLMFMVIILLF